MKEYPIEGLMNTAMGSIKEMVDVNTIIGEPIETNSNVVIIPVSKVNFGFAAGGSEFEINNKKIENRKDEKKENDNEQPRMPFGGGSGAGVSISPIAFIVVQPTGVKLLPVEHNSSLDKLLDLIPDLVDKANRVMEKQLDKINKNNKEYYKSETKNSKNGNTTTSEVVKKETKPYDFEFDETGDM